MPWLSSSLFTPISLLSIISAFLFFYPLPISAEQHPTYPDFAQPIPSFTLNNYSITFPNEQNTGSITMNITDDAIYRHVKTSFDGQNWAQHTIDPNLPGNQDCTFHPDDPSHTWLTGTCTLTVSLSASGFSSLSPGTTATRNYVTAYSCDEILFPILGFRLGWDCHDGWQILQFNATLASSSCGNGDCDGVETCSSCPQDCGYCIEEADYYVAPGGNDNNPGTIDLPWRTWGKAFRTAQAGDLVYFRGGVYYSASDNIGGERDFNSGTAGNYIKFFNYPGETPILDCSLRDTTGYYYNKGIAMWNVQYIYMKGLQLRNVRQGHNDVNVEGVEVVGSGNFIFENLVLHDIDGQGLIISGQSGTILIKNCDSYNLNDALRTAVYPNPGTPGQNGVGFGIATGVQNNNILNSKVYFEGCRTWNFSDNGFALGGVGYIEAKNCWAFDGGMLYGDGCGFKMRPTLYSTDTVIPLQRYIINCISANNGYYAFSPNNNGAPAVNLQIYNSFAYHNGYKQLLGDPTIVGQGFVYQNNAGSPAPNQDIRNCISYDNEQHTVYGGNENWWAMTDVFNMSYNNWEGQEGSSYYTVRIPVSDDDFVSLDMAQLMAPRKADGSLPDITFGHLASGSDLIDAGTDVGLPYSGSAPDLGPFEYAGTAPVCSGSSAQSCSIANGVGSQTRICVSDGVWSDWGTCTVVSCNSGYHISGNSCVPDSSCTSHTYSSCSDGDVYWFDSCAVREDMLDDCSPTQTCSGNACVDNPPPGTWQEALVSWWKLDGNVLDSAGENDGTNNGATVSITDCVSNSCYIFDGIDDYIQMPDVEELQMYDSDFTFAAWIKPGSYPLGADSWGVLGAESNGAGLVLYTPAGNLRLMAINMYHSPYSGLSPPLIQWSFIAATFDSQSSADNLILYLDESSHTSTFDYDFGEGRSTMYIARSTTSPARYFNGSIDEVMIFNRTLSEEEISAVYLQFL